MPSSLESLSPSVLVHLFSGLITSTSAFLRAVHHLLLRPSVQGRQVLHHRIRNLRQRERLVLVLVL
jgi:hypothetical protein